MQCALFFKLSVSKIALLIQSLYEIMRNSEFVARINVESVLALLHHKSDIRDFY